MILDINNSSVVENSVCTIHASHDLHLKTAYRSFSALVSPNVETLKMMKTKIQRSRKKTIILFF